MSRSRTGTIFAVSAAGLAFSVAVVHAYLTDAARLSPPDYYTMQPPAAGHTYVDPVFGSTIKRISDSMVTPDAANGSGMVRMITNEYATMTPFNKDSSRLLLQHNSYFALYDGAGDYVRDLPFEINSSSEPRWSRRDPNVLYFLQGNRLKQHDVSTGTTSVVHTFSEYTRIRGNGESDICFDGDHFVLAGDGRQIFVYEISTGRKGPVLETGGRAFDQIYITPNDNVLVGWMQSGTGRYNGVELYNRNMVFQRQVGRAIGHMDVTRDTTGDEVMVWANSADPSPICNNGVVKVRLSDARQTCLISLAWSIALHVSGADNGWVFVETYIPADPNPLGALWVPYANEILQIRVDGSQIRRLAHHRSRPFNSYWYTPRVATNREGTRLVYASNYGLQSILGRPADYSDAYLLTVPGGPVPSPTPTPTPVPTPTPTPPPVSTRYPENSPAVTYTGAWLANTNPMHSGGRAVLAKERGATATLTFTGTGVRWLGYQDERAGIARVLIDGVRRATVDTYATPFRNKAVLYAVQGLAPGKHVLTIKVVNRRNVASADSWVWVDTFVVTR